MTSEGKNSVDSNEGLVVPGHTVRFSEAVYTDDDSSPPPARLDGDGDITSSVKNQSNQRMRTRRQSGILKRRVNTITTADAPPIILSDEGLKAGRVSPFLNFPLFLTMTIRSIGIVFGD
ncbi:unnamed protein product, partial [Adineta steineri]